MFFALVMLGVIASSVWVLVDAETHKVPANRRKPYSASNGSAAWFIGCLLLWIVGFPWYLIARSAVLAERPSTPLTPTVATPLPMGATFCATCGTALAAGAGFCSACGSRVPVSAGVQPSLSTPPSTVEPASLQAVPLAAAGAQPSASTPVSTGTAPGPVAPPSWQAASLAPANTQLSVGMPPSSWQAARLAPTKPARSRGWVVIVAAAVVVLATVGVAAVAHGAKANQDALKTAAAAKEGLHSLQVGVQSYAVDHGDQYPDASLVTETGLVDSSGTPYLDYWPSNPYTGLPMQQGSGPGDFSYTTGATTFQMTVFGHDGEALLTVP